MEKALLDSAVKYERLKPTFYNLQNAYEYRGKEVQDLREALRLSELQSAVQKQESEQRIAELKKQITELLKKARKQFWKGFKGGFGTGVAIGTVAGISI